MKALQPSAIGTTTFGAARLYRDDLEAAIGLLSNAGLKTRIACSRFEYESIDELARAAGPTPKDVKFEGVAEGYWGNVSLHRSGRLWFVSSYDESLRGVANELEAILRKRQTRVHALPLFWVFQAGTVTLGVGGMARTASASTSLVLLAIGGALWVVSLALSLYWYLFPGLVLKYRHDSFLSRNRDSILLLVAGGVITVVIQALFSRFTGP